ncbi:MAG: ExeM/NucH family extracellular endonuclease [Chloroflexaceae bacterium]
MSMFRMRSFAGLPLALWVVVALLLPLVASGMLLRVTPVRAQSSDLVITGVIDGPLSGGVPKAIELYALTNISDLSIYGLESANNGNPAGGPEFTFPADTASAGEFLYVASESTGFTDFFDFAPDYTGGVAGINGDDAIALYQNGTIVDVFGEIGVDGTGEPWEHLDGWAYRVDDTGPDGNTFELSTWTFSDPNALDGETSNNTAATPFPIGTYSTGGGGDPGQPLPLEEGFDDCTLAGWEIISVDSDTANTWSCSENFSNAEANGFGDSAPADEWLITPPLNMDAQDNEVLTFRNWTNFSDSGVPYPQLEVVYSTDYAGSGDPTSATWIELSGINFSPEDSGQWLDSGKVDLAGISGTNVYFAFHYTSSGTSGGNAASWRIDSINFFVDDGGGPELAFIHEIQGDGPNVVSGDYTIEAIVVGDYQGGDQLDGFFVQEEDADIDTNPATSEGLFIYCNTCPVDVAVGDKVQVTGSASDFFDMSQLSATGADDITIISADNPLPTPAQITLPVPGVPTDDLSAAEAVINAYYEQFEGMLVAFPSLTVAEYFQLGRFGQVVLTEGGRIRQFTDANMPDAAGLIAHEIDRARRTVILDDDNNIQNAPIETTPDSPYFYPRPGLSITNFFRGGDTIDNLTGVLHWSWAGFGGTDAWRIRPGLEAFSYDFTADNMRPANPADVGGNVKVASFNVLNYFTTIDDGSDICGPTGGLGCRGANSLAELQRQRDKIVSALVEIDADIVGLVEIENDANDAALNDLVTSLNAATAPNTYAAVNTGPIGTDAIRVAFIYQPARVSLVGNFAVLDTPEFVSPNTTDPKNRPALAQTFQHDATGAIFTVVVNHLKSKGSGCGMGDDDTTTGQGNCNLTRTLAAQELADWLAGDPTASGDPDFMIIGDLNAYRNEDPIVALENAGYTDLIDLLLGDDAYSFVFDGQIGYLDYALANASLLPQVSGITEWHINADEINLFDYNDDIEDSGERSFERESSALPIYDPNPYRSSDHDPVIVGLNLEAEVEPVEPLTLTSICNAADGSHQWRVRNPNDFDVPFTWQRVGTSETGEGVALASSDTFFFTPTAGTVKIFWDNNGTPAETVKAANNEPCTLPTGNITIVKQATPAAPWLDWTFDGDLGAFTLDNDSRDDAHLDRQTFEVAAGSYTVNETNKRGNWDLEIVCESNGESTFATDGTAVTITLAAGDDVTCTYNNLRRSQIRITKYADTNGNGERDADEAGLEGWQMFLYLADGNGGWQQIQPREVRTNGRGIANYTSLEPGVDHLVCEEDRTGWSTTEPANPIEHDGKICQVVADLVYGEVRRVSFGNREEPPAQTLYRARQVGARVWIERNVEEAGLGDFDPDGNGWALVGRTNGAADNGELRDFFVEEGVPYAIVFNRSNNKGDRCILLTPRSLDVVKKGQTRLMTTVEDPVACPVE